MLIEINQPNIGTMNYVIKDHQGSMYATVTGNTVERYSFDAWGRRRNPQTLSYDNVTTSFDRGYTLHEHYDDFGLINMNGRLYDPTIGRFMQTDPMAEKYYWISPYAYCANNPIKFVDPTGEDIWEINNEGRIINRIKDKSQDAFYMVEQDADGNYQRTFTTDAEGNKIYNNISFEYGTIESQRSISFSPDSQTTDTYDVYRIRGDNNGTALFEFMSNNISGSRTGVEISQAMTGIKGDKGLNFITTGHTKAKEPGMTHLLMGQLLNGYTIRELNHSHPYTPNPSTSDKRFASQIKDIMKQRNISVPEFNLYYVPDKQKIPFGR